MGVTNTKGLKVLMSTGTVPGAVIPTAITSAAPAVVTVADTAGMADGQVVKMTDTGFEELDGQLFVVGGLTGTDFNLVGSDTTNTTGTLAVTPLATYYDDTTDMEQLCLSTIGVNPETSTPVSVATFCDTSAQVDGIEAGAGTIDLGFWLDKDDAGYAALMAAESDSAERVFKITFPGGNGDMVFEGTVSGLNFTDIPLDGSPALIANITLVSKYEHRF
ncbi:hypothetical protein DRH27_00530 [Candidatus Falkowbacteria bacterium]|nr:MAG: hypothetical protein DRH27_00530 [Candidatus Falkowbacteria bacterium]